VYPRIDIGPWNLTTYTVSHVVGILVAAALSYRELRRIEFHALHALGALVFLVFFTHVGAHAYHVLLHLARYLTDSRGLFNFWNRGLTIHGGMVGAGLALLLVSWISRRSPWQIADALAPAATLSLVFFRLGCLGRGCCSGQPCGEDFLFAGLTTKLIQNMEVSVHPTQLYAAAAALLLFAILWVLRKRKHFEGELVIVFLLYLGTQRFLLEFLRASHLKMHTSLTLFSQPLNTSQIFALAFFALGVVLLAFRWRAFMEGIGSRKKTGIGIGTGGSES